MLKTTILSVLIVSPKITPFSFGGDPLNYDEPGSITCMISGGDLPMSVGWKFNRAPIQPFSGIITEKRGERIHTLMIEAVKAKHAGIYTCIAENIAGMVELSSRLVVNG